MAKKKRPRFTLEEDIIIQEMSADGKSDREIAETLSLWGLRETKSINIQQRRRFLGISKN